MIASGHVEARRREGYLSERLTVIVARIGGPLRVRTSLDVLEPGHRLGVRLLDEARDIDDFEVHDAVRARFFRADDAGYEFGARVIGVDRFESMLWLTSPMDIERIQARRHVRAITDFAADIATAGPRRLNDRHSGRHTVLVRDMSAGGLGISTPIVLVEGSVVIVDAFLPDRKSHVRLEARARVVRSEIESPPRAETRYRYGLEYLDLVSKQESQLVSSVFWQLGQQRTV